MLYKIVMKVEEKSILSKLFDAYGRLLSEGQQDVMVQYLDYDITVTEIAQNLNVSRQAVKDSVTKAEKKLFEFEEKLGLVAKMDLLTEENALLKKKLSKKED